MTALLDDAAERRIRELKLHCASAHIEGKNEARAVEFALRAAWTEATEAAALKCDAIAKREAAHGSDDKIENRFCDGAKLGAEQCAAAIRGGKL